MKLLNAGLNWRIALKFKDEFTEFLVSQALAGAAAVMCALVGLTLIYKPEVGFFVGFFEILGTRVAFAGFFIIILNIILTYFGLKKQFDKINKVAGVKLMISVITYVWLTIVTVLAGAVWL